MAWGTELMTSSESEETNGRIMIPMTTPAARALSLETANPMDSAVLRISGATVSAAKNP